MRAESLDQAIKWQNEPDYGLTAGLHSLDPDEQSKWAGQVQAGNLYINRQTTGAIVRRQPFGGWKRSSIGPGAKAGGPNYVLGFAILADAADNARADVERSYRAAWSEHFGKLHDPSRLKAEANIFRYRPARGVILRLPTRDAALIARAELASELTRTPLTISVESETSDQDFIASLPTLAASAEFLRTVCPPSDAVLSAAYSAGLNWIDAPLTCSGRAELRLWMREQAVSRTLHRYGQIPDWMPSSRRFLA
jgi:RHH-type proline utilization regulon transcriptional repressor/proline dehydrogenase/delta 1-pyrroline-5-carboxylate dehydrogenase